MENLIYGGYSFNQAVSFTTTSFSTWTKVTELIFPEAKEPSILGIQAHDDGESVLKFMRLPQKY